MTRILVVASSPIVRAGLEAMLREDPRFTVLTNPGTPTLPARNGRPDVLLMEMAAADRLARHSAFIRDDAPPTVLLADHLGRAELRRALHSGVRAVLPRDATSPEIMAAIEGAAAGLIVLKDMDALLPADAEVVPADVIPGEALVPGNWKF